MDGNETEKPVDHRMQDQVPDVAAGIMRAFEEAAADGGVERVGAEPEVMDRPDPVKMLDDAFERLQLALGTNVLPFARKPTGA